jgi:hypothetical protein
MGGQDENMITELVSTFDRTVGFMREQVADLSDTEMVLQPPGVPNHAAWTLGHVIHGCQAIAAELGVSSWLPDDWELLFGYGSSPGKVVGAERSSKAALLSCLDEAGDRLRTALLATDEGRLLAPLRDEESRDIFPTMGDALLQILCAHTAFHAGQLAVWRRAIGREPVGVFI